MFTISQIFAILTVVFGGFALSRLTNCSQAPTKNPSFDGFFVFSPLLEHLREVFDSLFLRSYLRRVRDDKARVG